MKKKPFALVLVAVLLTASLSACTQEPSEPENTQAIEDVLQEETNTPTPEAAPETDLAFEKLPEQDFPWQQENSTVPDVFSIESDGYPTRYDLTEAERTALWEMFRAAEYTPVAFESISAEIEPYSAANTLYGAYEGYYRISWYYEGAPTMGSAQLWPGNIIGAGSWYRYDEDSFDRELLRTLCDVPQTIYSQTEDDIRAASAAVKADQERRGDAVREIRYDEQLCSAFMDTILHLGPAGQRTEVKAEDTIVLLLDSADGPELKSEYAVLHRMNNGEWEVVGHYPVPAA